MDIAQIGILPLFRLNRRRKGGYEHKEQFDFYSYVGSEEAEAEPSLQFRKRYRFTEKTVKALVALLGNEIIPHATTNHAFSASQKLCIALRFYATGTHQAEVGDGEGASQSSVCRIVRQVTDVLANHADDLIKFNLDNEILERVGNGFYGFKASEFSCRNVI